MRDTFITNMQQISSFAENSTRINININLTLTKMQYRYNFYDIYLTTCPEFEQSPNTFLLSIDHCFSKMSTLFLSK